MFHIALTTALELWTLSFENANSTNYTTAASAYVLSTLLSLFGIIYF